MGRFNWIWKTLRTLSVVVYFGGVPTLGGAFTNEEYINNGGGTFPQDYERCNIHLMVHGGGGTARVAIFHMQRLPTQPREWHEEVAGGTYWLDYIKTTYEGSAITKEFIAYCIGIPVSNVTSLEQSGASAATFAQETYIGFKFTLSVEAAGKAAGAVHEYKVGSGSFPNNGPTANAGADQTAVTSAATVTLDGSGSSDPDTGDTLTYLWTQTAGTPVVTLSSTTASGPTFTAPTLGANDTAVNLTFSLIVTDDKSNASSADTVTITVNPPETPFAEFEAAEAEVRAIITQDATRSLNSTLMANQQMTRGARSRFIESRGQGDGDGAGFATRNNVPFDVDGTFDLDGARLSSKGTFFGQTGNVEGTERRLVFGEFDVQRDGDTGSTTATLTGRDAWEQMISDDTMLGYFVGGELADSNISGAFEGKQTRVAATAGGYAVRALSETLFADGFISIGAGRNNLEMADDVLALTSDYTTRTATVGGALTGVYAYERYELRPEMAFSYGKTWIGDVGFTGVAYGLTDNTLSVDAGTVSTASLTLRPEIVWALDAETVADSHAQLSFAPRFICERTMATTTSKNCGDGAEIGLTSTSEDGLSSANVRFVVDRVGNSNRSNVLFNVEHRF